MYMSWRMTCTCDYCLVMLPSFVCETLMPCLVSTPTGWSSFLEELYSCELCFHHFPLFIYLHLYVFFPFPFKDNTSYSAMHWNHYVSISVWGKKHHTTHHNWMHYLLQWQFYHTSHRTFIVFVHTLSFSLLPCKSLPLTQNAVFKRSSWGSKGKRSPIFMQYTLCKFQGKYRELAASRHTIK